MPPKRKIANNLKTKKQKQEIRKRLMQISFRLDEHIYNSKLINAGDATVFIDEIIRYKPLCDDDKHSLQVIEKLTRCMNSIIKEPNDCVAITGCPSPVYSLHDDDRTDVADITPSFHTIDLTEDESDNACVQVNVDVEIHRAISTLSLRDDLVNNTQCSQSILENYKVNSIAPLNRANASEEIDKVLGTVSTSSLDIDLTRNNDVMLYNKSVTNLIADKDKESNEENKVGVNNKKVNKAEKNVTDNIEADPTVVINKKSKMNKQDITEKAKMTKRNNRKLTEKVTDTTKRNTIASTTNQTVQMKSLLTSRNTKKTTKPRRKQNGRQVKDYIKIYNNSVVEDLSWIENIRYVREISKDEYDLKLMWEDNFWENCTLPSDNNEDFSLY